MHMLALGPIGLTDIISCDKCSVLLRESKELMFQLFATQMLQLLQKSKPKTRRRRQLLERLQKT